MQKGDLSPENWKREVYLFVQQGKTTLMEEIPEAYKDVSEVVDVVHNAGIGKKVAMLKPLAVIKG